MGGSTVFRRLFFISEYQTFCRRTFKVLLISCIGKFYTQEKIVHITIFCRKFSVPQKPKNFLVEPFLPFRNFVVWKKTLNWREEGCHVSPSELFCLIVPKNIVGEPFVFQKISGMEKIKIKRAVSRFFVDNFLPHMTKNFLGEHLRVLESVWYEKNMSNKWGVSWFSVGTFLSKTAEKFRGEPLNVSETLGYQNFFCLLGGITIFHPKFLVSNCRKTS